MSQGKSKIGWRPVHFLVILLCLLFSLDASLYLFSKQRQARLVQNSNILDIVTSGLGLTDLCVSTEARYTRHPAVSDPLVPFMDHPGAIEHFPSGSFWTPPQTFQEVR